jgi:transposase-like protein
MAKRVHTAEFKREALRLASRPGVSQRPVAKELGIHPNLLGSWQTLLHHSDQGNERPRSSSG